MLSWAARRRCAIASRFAMGLAMASWFAACALHVHFGRTLPRTPMPSLGRIDALVYKSAIVYMTEGEYRLLVGLFACAMGGTLVALGLWVAHSGVRGAPGDG